ncbi:MAG: glycerol-3-phosphate 1-O-acyltransferase [Dehalococcoidia bacterium]|nr:glycerol-3-phosphate 1-O-acyltransferase [Dehalococcoidia bacterium]
MLLVSALIGYILGSLPVALTIGKLFRGVDVRDSGSGKTGATNVLRTLGWKFAIPIIIWDIGKGILAVLISRALTDSNLSDTLAASGALIGHVWPITSGFRGGRGVMTGLGTVYVISPITAIPGTIFTLTIIATTRYVSLGSILGSASQIVGAFMAWWMGKLPAEYAIFVIAASTFIILIHRDNIERLIQGRERKIGEKALPVKTQGGKSA